MAEFPALPLWTDAYLADTGHLTFEEHGLYLNLLILMWRSPECRIPNDDSWLERHFHCEIDKIKLLCREFCETDGNWLWQKRLRKEREYCLGRKKSQSSNGSSRWENRSKENASIRSARMSAAKKKGKHTKAEWLALKELFGCCVHCGSKEFPLEKDHVLPVYQGGSDSILNIQPSCAKCNAHKGPENTDKRPLLISAWLPALEDSVGYKLLITDKISVSQISAPIPTPTPLLSKDKKEKDDDEVGKGGSKKSKPRHLQKSKTGDRLWCDKGTSEWVDYIQDYHKAHEGVDPPMQWNNSGAWFNYAGEPVRLNGHAR